MIILITYHDERKCEIVSHGINEATGKVVILPQETPRTMGAKFEPQIGHWILED
jgi:hypothetical protein